MQPKAEPHRSLKVLGTVTDRVGWKECVVSTVTALSAIFLVYLVSAWFLHTLAALLVVTSMGSSAVLLFAAPHGTMSQPWPFFGGHLVSAVTGVTCVVLVPEPALAAGLAVGLSVGAMQLLRCVHAPGGATALAAALGGPTVYGLGYLFILMPLLLNLAVLFTMAVIANYPFAWRRYPATLAQTPHDRQPGQSPIEAMDLVVDVSSEELNEISRRTLEHARGHHPQGLTLSLNRCFIHTGQDHRSIISDEVPADCNGRLAAQNLNLHLVLRREAGKRLES